MQFRFSAFWYRSSNSVLSFLICFHFFSKLFHWGCRQILIPIRSFSSCLTLPTAIQMKWISHFGFTICSLVFESFWSWLIVQYFPSITPPPSPPRWSGFSSPSVETVSVGRIKSNHKKNRPKDLPIYRQIIRNKEEGEDDDDDVQVEHM